MNPSPRHTIRIITAASLFDGHDAAINIMRRIMQAKGAEVIHLGHNRSVQEIVEAAIEEDVQAIAITSYQGGHLEFFKYMKDLLDKSGCSHIKIFGGGGGTILPDEIETLHRYGIARIYSPDDGRHMGLEGMIDDVIQQAETVHLDADMLPQWNSVPLLNELKDIRLVARAITLAENGYDYTPFQQMLLQASGAVTANKIPVLGITGTGGAGKSSVTDEIVRRFLKNYPDKTIAVISVDPSKKKSGGALLGDRIRMNAVSSPRVYMRSLATRESSKALSRYVQQAIDICKAAGYDFIILESAGTGQSDVSILDYVDISMYVMTPEYGAASQLEKINMLDYAHLVCINKFDKAGALDALHDVRKQYKRNHGLWTAKDDELPVTGTIAAQFNDAGINELFERLMQIVAEKYKLQFDAGVVQHPHIKDTSSNTNIIPPGRSRYLAEITDAVQQYNQQTTEQAAIATQLYQLDGVIKIIQQQNAAGQTASQTIAVILQQQYDNYAAKLHPDNLALITQWHALTEKYSRDVFEYEVRGKTIQQPLTATSLSGTKIPKVALPAFKDWGDILSWQLQENVPGAFPFTAGVFPLKREGEDPTRMFAGEGSPERTNRRFHYVSLGQPAKRLSTAFDSVTLYGEDPDYRPDIYGKVGNSGVSIATLDDIKKLYSGFDLCDAKTSVSMTINGPAPVLLAFFMHAAIDQQCEKYIIDNNLQQQVNSIIESKYAVEALPKYTGNDGKPVLPFKSSFKGQLPEGNDGLGLRLLGLSGADVLPPEVYAHIKAKALATVRGTVQADILKEDQAQNTCIFSTEFALKLMGDVQQYFIQHKVQNFYSVSISGYHIAEAGANPITQLAFTLANGFTYVEYYLSRGMPIDDFAPNLSFFFSNGMDPEYSVIGRVARRIWAKAMKYKYGANERSQKLKYHIQTSGRSLHAQEIDFNDIRTTLQALYAIYDNCNSLHTNAYDEAITTPTEESVRRAMAIQLIINKELGTAKNENPNQGAFIIDTLTELVEAAVLTEFNRISERGGVLGAMERMYQRNKIQEESLHYETLKHTGEFPVIGVNTFLNKKGSPTILPTEVIRSTEAEKQGQVQTLQAFKERHNAVAAAALQQLQQVAIHNGNLFAELMETVKYCSLGQITHALYEVGGQYRRNM
ncbi:MAG TPA: methylmalonyl-CoA mutase family protein [Ferruginibacter sp.]|nr:methylmalonyl-CoA mutase family protein [Ferruginibacter sp.]HMP19453.1 methylmalonyl-CoA mutase family protein [Ferruginibacter sp.]